MIGLIKGLGITIRHLFEKDITIQYPEEMPFLQERYRGSLGFDFAKCRVCNLCIRACPNNVLGLESTQINKKRYLLNYSIDLQYCLFCNLCVESCPADCLYFTHDFELTEFKRDDIKKVYNRPDELPLPEEEQEAPVQKAEAGQEGGAE